MGHVDHGKTSLLDAHPQDQRRRRRGRRHHPAHRRLSGDDRRPGRTITFLDTPGHAAFTAMRARGAQVTDIVVLVVAADDGVMPQTVEAINHAKAAGVPMIVAINKIDKPGANPTGCAPQLLQHEVVVEEMGGDVLDVEVSRRHRQGPRQAARGRSRCRPRSSTCKANPDRAAEGAVIEAKLDVGRGPVATVLVQKGTLKRGDIFVVGDAVGPRPRAAQRQGRARSTRPGRRCRSRSSASAARPRPATCSNVGRRRGAGPARSPSYRAAASRATSAPAWARATTLDQLLAKAKADRDVQGAADRGQVRRAGLGRGDRAGAGEDRHTTRCGCACCTRGVGADHRIAT